MSTNRRAILACILSVTSSSLAGCSWGESSASDDTAGENIGPSSNEPALSDEFEEAKRKLNRAYEEIGRLPIVDDGELVFDVKTFEREFDHRDVMEKADDAFKAINSLDEEEDAPDDVVEKLTAAARLAHSLAERRLILNDIIANGILFGYAFQNEAYETSLGHVRDARTALSYVPQNDGRIDEQLALLDGATLDIPSYNRERIVQMQRVVDGIVSWTTPTYDGFQSTSRGLIRMMAGSEALNENRPGEAREFYIEAEDHFLGAVHAFDSAQGRGRPLPQIEGLFESIRCQVPKLRDGVDELQQALGEFADGNEEEARKKANEAFLHLEQISRICD